MSKTAFYNGILYQIEYQPQLSNSDYTQHKVYHIKTEDENYPHARKAIASIMEDELGYKQDEIWSKGLWQIKKTNKSHQWSMPSMCTMSSHTMKNLICMYILLSDLMMTKYDYR